MTEPERQKTSLPWTIVQPGTTTSAITQFPRPAVPLRLELVGGGLIVTAIFDVTNKTFYRNACPIPLELFAPDAVLGHMFFSLLTTLELAVTVENLSLDTHVIFGGTWIWT
jgi:hypothetical protein